MASLLERWKACEIYFNDNWVSTPIQIQEDKSFDNNSIDSYIRLNYVNTDNTSTIGRKQGYGTLQVFCYHRREMLSAKLADEVSDFFDCLDLERDVHSKVGVQFPIQDLDNDFFMTLIQFPIEQYS